MTELFDWGWVFDNMDEVGSRTREHIELTLYAVAVGALISIPLGILVQRRRRLYAPVTSVAGIMYTIPSLALFAFLVPFTGLSVLTAEIGLVSYTLLIIIRNVVAGLDGVPGDAREAAVGMGYGTRQLLWKVDVPLALPVIFAGIRLATVTTIGLVTVTSLIGQGGFGYFIRQGLQNFFYTEAILGAVLSVMLAIVADRLLVLGERLLTPWARAPKRRTRT